MGYGKSDNSGTTTMPVVIPVVKEAVSGVWAKGNTYKITGHIQVPASTSLVIEEGVTVIFSDSTVKPEMIVRGNLYATGTAAAPVKFTIPDA